MTIVNDSVEASLDAAAGSETTCVMSVGDTFNGILDDRPDEDRTSIELERGKTCRITLSGRGSAPDKAEDFLF